MSIDAVQGYNDGGKSSNFLIPKATAIGAATGYLLKQTIPLTSQEKDTFYLNRKFDSLHNAYLFKRQGLEKMVAENVEGAKVLENIILAKKPILPEIKNASEEIKTSVMNIIKQLNKIGAKERKFSTNSLDAYTKSMRSAKTYTIVGASLGLFAGLVGTLSHEQKQLSRQRLSNHKLVKNV